MCERWRSPVLARIRCSLLTKSAMYCLLTVLEEPAEKLATSLTIFELFALTAITDSNWKRR